MPFRQSEKVVLEENEVVNQDFFIAGEDVNIKGTVNGDLYAAGGSVIVDGIVNGDVLATGGDIEINGKVNGNTRVAGGNIKVKGSLSKNLTAGAGNIEIEKEATIGGSLVFGAGNVQVDGPVAGNIVAGVGNLVINNNITGSVYAGVGQLQINDQAKIMGNITYWSDEEYVIEDGAVVVGQINHQFPSENKSKENNMRSFGTGFRVFSLLSMVVIGLLMLRFFPGLLETGAGFIDQKPWQSLGFGFLKLILEPIAAIILMITIIGLPIGIFLMFAYIIELYFASYIVAYYIGRLIWNKFNKTESRYWSFVLGALIFVLITSVPMVAGIVRFFSILFGLGAILLVKYSWYKKTFVKK